MESCKAVEKGVDELLKKFSEYDNKSRECIDESLEQLSKLQTDLKECMLFVSFGIYCNTNFRLTLNKRSLVQTHT